MLIREITVAVVTVIVTTAVFTLGSVLVPDNASYIVSNLGGVTEKDLLEFENELKEKLKREIELKNGLSMEAYLKKLEQTAAKTGGGIAGLKGQKGDPGPQGPKGDPGPAPDLAPLENRITATENAIQHLKAQLGESGSRIEKVYVNKNGPESNSNIIFEFENIQYQLSKCFKVGSIGIFECEFLVTNKNNKENTACISDPTRIIDNIGKEYNRFVYYNSQRKSKYSGNCSNIPSGNTVRMAVKTESYDDSIKNISIFQTAEFTLGSGNKVSLSDLKLMPAR